MRVVAEVGENPFEQIAVVTTLPCLGGSDDYAAQKASDMEHANLQLMTAAPDLLEALKSIIVGKVTMASGAVHPSGLFCTMCGLNSTKEVHGHFCPVKQAELAIAKAEGKP